MEGYIAFSSNFTKDISAYHTDKEGVVSEITKEIFIPTNKVVYEVLDSFINSKEIETVLFLGVHGAFREIEKHIEAKYKGVQIIWQ